MAGVAVRIGAGGVPVQRVREGVFKGSCRATEAEGQGSVSRVYGMCGLVDARVG